MTARTPGARVPVAQRREALIAAAIRVMARDGLAAATTRAIVAEAGMPLGSFHYAFGSREALLSAVVDTVTGAERMAVESVWLTANSPEPDLTATLRAGLERYLELLAGNPEREQALLELSLHSIRRGDPDGGAAGQYRSYHRSAEQLLVMAAEACGQGWSVPTSQVARLLVVLLDGLTTTWLADRDTAAARLTARFAASALAALATSPSVPSPTTKEYASAD